MQQSSLANLSMGLQAAGAVSSVIGSFYSAKMTKNQLAFEADTSDINARMSDINARIAELGARQELFKGQAEVGSLTMQAGQLKSRQRTAMAANGIVLGEGNAAEIQASAEILKQIDVNTIEANAVRSAWSFRTQGVNYEAEAASRRSTAAAKRGTASSISPLAAASSSLLSSAATVASSWYRKSGISVDQLRSLLGNT